MSDALIWIKSSYSGGGGSECVEVAALPSGVAIRDSKDPDGPVLRFTAEDWKTFTDRVKSQH
jgi:Domain of unknown function (DUF397)